MNMKLQNGRIYICKHYKWEKLIFKIYKELIQLNSKTVNNYKRFWEGYEYMIIQMTNRYVNKVCIITDHDKNISQWQNEVTLYLLGLLIK
jgi:hypothetical protein